MMTNPSIILSSGDEDLAEMNREALERVQKTSSGALKALNFNQLKESHEETSWESFILHRIEKAH